MKLKLFFILIAVMAIFSLVLFAGGCRKNDSELQAEGQQTSGEDASGEETGEASQDGEQAEDAPEGKSQDAEAEVDPEEDEGETGDEEEAVQEEAEEEVEMPQEITAKIQEADGLFADGMYAEASKEYRNAQITIEGSGLPDESKQELLDAVSENYETANNIVDTARMHHSNAMNLIYEKRYEEAEAELNAALEIYPKYQTAIDALESLEDIKGLQ